jgi:signal transduction histidine kinase
MREAAGRPTAQREVGNDEPDCFSYSVSHELRAPLWAIDGFSRIGLEDYSGPLADGGKVCLQKVRNGMRQTGRLIDELLDFAHLGRHSLAK